MALSANKPEEYDEFTIEQKKKMAAKISAIRTKTDLRKIKNIIFTENPNVMVNKDSGGMLMFFQNLTPATYTKLDKYIKEMDAKKVCFQTDSITKTSEALCASSQDCEPVQHKCSAKFLSESDDTLMRSRYKYSNSEKYIMKKKEYNDLVTSEQKTSKNIFTV